MKITNISPNTIYLRDLKFLGQAQTEGRRGEDRYIHSGASVYLPNTSQVLRSVIDGDIRTWLESGVVTIEDRHVLNTGASVTLNHNFGYAPVVYVLKRDGSDWVDATGTFDVVHTVTPGITPQVFTSVTVTNTSGGSVDYMIRLC